MMYGLTMKPEAKKLWTGSLRSGHYQQGKSALWTHSNEYCCLGVFAQSKHLPSRKGDGDLYWVFSFPVNDSRTGDDRSSTSLIPEWFEQFFDYDHSKDEVQIPYRTKVDAVKDLQNDLINLNDDKGLSFSRIADWIEANL